MTPPRRPSPPPTRPPPPPDPLDAADFYLDRARDATAKFRYSEDFEEDTRRGDQHAPLVVVVPDMRGSNHEIQADVSQPSKAPQGVAAAFIVLVACLAAVCKALGWL